MLIIFTNCYQRAAPYQTSHVSCMRRRLPIVTRILARGAKPPGGFGLVVPRFTNAYHSGDLAPTLPRASFTKHHRLVIATGIIDCYNVLDVLTVVGDEAIPIYFTFRVGRVVTGLCE